MNLPEKIQAPFFVGILGTGMSALAQFMALSGSRVQGSDRSWNPRDSGEIQSAMVALGIDLFPQDGTGPNRECSCLVVSTAVEAGNPDWEAGKNLGIPVLHRSELLAMLVDRYQTIAITGTSGKSTVSGMLFWILRVAGMEPSFVGGAELRGFPQSSPGEPPRLGNAWVGRGPWLVIEADESDGSFLHYSPAAGIMLNIEKDHKELSELVPLFRSFREQVLNWALVNEGDPRCRVFAKEGDHFFGEASCLGDAFTNLVLHPWSSEFSWRGTDFRLPLPGAHNRSNASAAIGAAVLMGLTPAQCASALESFPGIRRRHVLMGVHRDITVVDDFAHNPAKIAASLSSVLPHASRLLAVFHPHGYGPMKLLGTEICEALVQNTREGDSIYLPEIYDAGGSADRSISSRSLVQMLVKAGRKAVYHPDKQSLRDALVKEARPGDWIVSMGARDPRLETWARELAEALRS